MSKASDKTKSFSWSTVDEMNSIDFMASNEKRHKDKQLSTISMKQRLRGYIEASLKRTAWAGINQVKCIAYAQTKLTQL